jgi:hypothetical protein
MIQHIESFQSKRHVQSFVDWKYAGDLGIHLILWEPTKGVSPEISIPSKRARGDLRDSRWVEIRPVYRTLP